MNPAKGTFGSKVPTSSIEGDWHRADSPDPVRSMPLAESPDESERKVMVAVKRGPSPAVGSTGSRLAGEGLDGWEKIATPVRESRIPATRVVQMANLRRAITDSDAIR